MDTDFHLDTSWCPVCDCAIPPKRITVPITPLPTAGSSTAVRSSQTTRGKNGTIKARPGGLVQGTGRVRPALNRMNSSKGRTAQQDFVEENAPVRTRTVIDQAPTPLYCSEECRKLDLEQSWPIALPPARAVLEAERRPSRVRLGAHPSQLNPARASPPPPSPTLPPAPPNSYRAPFKARELELNMNDLVAGIQEVDEHSDSSSATGTSFTASDRSPVEEQDRIIYSNLDTDPPPPPLAPLPLHPHRPSAPVVSPDANRGPRPPLFEGGIMMAAKRLQALLSIGIEDEETREERRAKEEHQKKEEARMRKWDSVGEAARSSSSGREKKQEKPPIDPMRWTELVYNYSSNPVASSSSKLGVPSTHRRSSDSDPSKKNRAEVPNRAQSALELYAKYPLFTSSSSANRGKPAKSSASLATSYTPAFGITSSSSSSKTTTSEVSSGTAGASALTLPGVDPALYAGKRLGGPRHPIAKGVEGRLVLPDVLLRPVVPVSSSLPSGSGSPASPSKGMRRSESEASVNRRVQRSSSALGALKESEAEGIWHRPEDGSEDSRSSASRSSTSEQRDRRSRREKSRRSSRSGSKQSAAEEPNWSYENFGPVYDAMPPVPVKQRRFEEIFVPDETPAVDEQPFIQCSALHARDVEVSRMEIREIGRRRGQHKGRTGWWVEKEWEVTVIPERKRLFLFGGSNTAGRRV